MDGSYDEVFAGPGRPREHAQALAGALAQLGPEALSDAGRMRDSIFMQQGSSLAGEDHVKIGHGRHYSDVPPVKGVYRGGAAAELEASVRMTRTDAARPAPAA